MKNIERNKMQNINNTWCLEQAAARFMDNLSQEQIDVLTSLDFPWNYWENELDKAGFHWNKNNPAGKRWKDL